MKYIAAITIMLFTLAIYEIATAQPTPAFEFKGLIHEPIESTDI